MRGGAAAVSVAPAVPPSPAAASPARRPGPRRPRARAGSCPGAPSPWSRLTRTSTRVPGWIRSGRPAATTSAMRSPGRIGGPGALGGSVVERAVSDRKPPAGIAIAVRRPAELGGGGEGAGRHEARGHAPHSQARRRERAFPSGAARARRRPGSAARARGAARPRGAPRPKRRARRAAAPGRAAGRARRRRVMRRAASGRDTSTGTIPRAGRRARLRLRSRALSSPVTPAAGSSSATRALRRRGAEASWPPWRAAISEAIARPRPRRPRPARAAACELRDRAREARALVDDLDPHACAERPAAQLDPAPRVLDRVGQQVPARLGQPHAVAAQHRDPPRREHPHLGAEGVSPPGVQATAASVSSSLSSIGSTTPARAAPSRARSRSSSAKATRRSSWSTRARALRRRVALAQPVQPEPGRGQRPADLVQRPGDELGAAPELAPQRRRHRRGGHRHRSIPGARRRPSSRPAPPRVASVGGSAPARRPAGSRLPTRSPRSGRHGAPSLWRSRQACESSVRVDPIAR